MGTKYEFSLIWPDYREGKEFESLIRSGKGKIYNQDVLERDINATMVMDGMRIRNESRSYVKARMFDMIQDEKIIKYRQEIMKDFIKYPEIADAFDKELLPLILRLHKMENTNLAHDDEARKIAWRIDMLTLYSQCMNSLEYLFNQSNKEFISEGMKKFQEIIKETVTNSGYIELQKMLPDLEEKIQGVSSLVIGINLDNELRPVEAVLLSIEPKPFKKRGIASTIFGTSKNDDVYNGIGTFYSIQKSSNLTTLDTQLFNDLTTVTKATFQNLAEVLVRFERVETEMINEILPEIYFYIGGSRLANTLVDAKLPICFPEPAPASERSFIINNIYDASFALRVISDTGIKELDKIVVTNDIEMSNKTGHIFVLTGANQGGKTTYTRALGISQLLFQAGMPVPGTTGRMSPVDNIYTHFPELEKNSISEGRLGEECQRLEAVLPRLTDRSLILMNESLSSTSHQECLFIAEEIMRFMHKIGCRALFATHIHELAEDIQKINAEPGLSKLVSLVAGVDEGRDMEVMTEDGPVRMSGSKRTYKILMMEPQGKSFALDIAKTYGISFEQLLNTHDKILMDKGE